MKNFVIDIDKCSGCYSCQMACKDEHCGNDWAPYAKPQPDSGQFWGKLNCYERGTVPKVQVTYIFVPCQHCEEAPCIESCPVEGALYERADGLIIIDPKKCSGCQNCIDACPYEKIFFNKDLQIAQKCTGCAHLIDKQKPISEPRCVDCCAHAAIKFGEESDLNVSGDETYHPEYEVNTRVRYLNLPKKFVAGTVYDPNEMAVVTGANCTLTGSSGTFTATTDVFGDFWFKELSEDVFSLKIEAGGKTYNQSDISTIEKDINVGDIPLS
jgi:Fe-S-cluster-containing dehydrogenase component